MNAKVFWIILIAVLLSFTGGFFLANALNKSSLETLRAENEQLKKLRDESSSKQSEASLSNEEIRQKIAEADRNPTDFAFQKNLGTALYRYATIKQDAELLAEAGRLLNRVYENDKNDYETTVMLGNIYFDLGYVKKENEKFQTAREFYQKALRQKPNDADVRTDLGLTYSLASPPENEKAILEFQKSLKENPKNEKTLQALTQFFLSENKPEEAEKYLTKLKEVNRNNQALSNLVSQLEQVKNNQKQ